MVRNLGGILLDGRGAYWLVAIRGYCKSRSILQSVVATLPLLLSLVPPSCIVASNRDLANTLCPFSSKLFISTITFNHNNMDIEIDIPREMSVSNSANVSRKSLVYSSVSFIPYVNKMEVQNNDSFWADQVEQFNRSHDLLLSYTTSKAREVNTNNKVTSLNNMLNPQDKGVAYCDLNIYVPQDIKTSSIPYEDHQLAELNSQDGEAYHLSIFGNNEFLEINSKNMQTSLL